MLTEAEKRTHEDELKAFELEIATWRVWCMTRLDDDGRVMVRRGGNWIELRLTPDGTDLDGRTIRDAFPDPILRGVVARAAAKMRSWRSRLCKG